MFQATVRSEKIRYERVEENGKVYGETAMTKIGKTRILILDLTKYKGA